MGDRFWEHVVKNNNGYACKFCEFAFAPRTSISRIKLHLSGLKGRGISICKRVPDNVKQAACLAIQDGKKRPRTMPSSSNDVPVQNPDVEMLPVETQRIDQLMEGRNLSGIEQNPDVEMLPVETQRIDQLMEGRNLSGIELGDWVNSMIGGELLIIGQGRAPEEVEAHPAKGKAFQTTKPVGHAFERNVDKIWSWLMSDDVLSIGIYGIGGVGKTSLLKYINDQLLQRPSSFQNVFWIAVTRDFSIYKLQNLIAKAVDLDLSNEEDEKKRAMKLSNGLMAKQKFVLILDDLWNHFYPEKVGIPVGMNGCRLILTTQSLRVCRRMGCQEEIKVEPLSEDEAWTLFMEKLGLSVELPAEAADIAKSVARECAGLPLGIIAMAGSMKHVDDIGQWRNALGKLRESKTREGDIEADIFKILEFSYMSLNDSALQQAFLYCALFPVDSEISREDLIEYMIVEGITAKRKSRQAESDKGHAMLNKLENACLIESCTREGYRCVRMNTLVRDMAIKIQRVNSQAIVEAGAQLETLPDIKKWTEDVVRVSLVKNYITEIPDSYSPRCPNLSTLLLSQNYILESIADSFFKQLDGLAVLDLSNTGIKSLPGSISNLVCLSTLLLRRCRQLMHVPTLANLKALKKLDLGYTELVKLPEGIKLLSNLRYLDLSHTKLKELSTGILPNLFRLQVLRALLSSETLVTFKGDEVACLKRLETLECNFRDLIDFNKYLKSWEDTQPPSAYYFSIGPVVPSLSTTHTSESSNTIQLHNCSVSRGADFLALPKTIQALEIVQCHDVTSLCDFSSLKYAIKLKSLVIGDCHGIECLLSFSRISVDTLQSLETLHLSNLKNLCALFSREGAPPLPFPSNGTFFSLKTCKIFKCPGMKELFPAGFLSNLQNLEVIEVANCDILEMIIAGGGGGGGIMGEKSNISSSNHSAVNSTEIILPKLRLLRLICLPELQSICNEVMICSSLEEINAVDCLKLKRIPISLSLPCLQKIKVKAYPRKWWESVKWRY